MRIRILLLAVLTLAGLALVVHAQVTSANNPLLKKALAQFPEADADGDGVLTMAEALAYQQKMAAAGKARETKQAAGLAPSHENLKYGPDVRNVLDFWQAKGAGPADKRPLVVFIHGGGFLKGDKSQGRNSPVHQQCIAAGVHYASINYRFRTTAPIQDILRDCARAIQFLRYKADELHIDKNRVASYGGSAGAGTSLWLAVHDDLADASSSDPVLRESTRLTVAGVMAGQATYDVYRWEEFLGPKVLKYLDPAEGPLFYGLKTEAEVRGEIGRRIRADVDMLGLISPGDAPVYLHATQPGGELTSRGHTLHHPLHAITVKKRCDEVGVEAVVATPGIPEAPKPAEQIGEFLLRHLGVQTAQ